jgi:hypothetical protein
MESIAWRSDWSALEEQAVPEIPDGARHGQRKAINYFS